MKDRVVTLPGLRMERRRRSNWTGMTDKHFHSYYELYYLWEGQRQYFISNKGYSIQAGAIVFIHPGHIHRTSGADGSPHERILLEIDESCYSDVFRRLQGETLLSLQRMQTLVLQLDREERSRIEWLLTELFREAEEKRAAYREYILLRLEEILLLMLRKRSGLVLTADNSEKHKKVYEIADYLSESFGEVESLDQLCGHFYISKSHLCHIFKDVTGMTIQEYITATRIKNAQRLLTETRQSVTAIAHTVGYGSITHFERMFKRLMGESPLNYRKNDGGGQ